jgi:hypothetical protein
MKKMKLKGLKAGYEVTMKNKLYNFGEGRHRYEVYELAGPKMDRPRIFVDTESVLNFVNEIEGEAKLIKSFTAAVKRASTKSERKELLAAKEIGELTSINLEKWIDADIRDSKAKRPEDTDK